MKRKGFLWEEFISEENIKTAFKESTLGRKKRKDIQAVLKRGEEQVVKDIQQILTSGWVPSPYKKKTICDKGKVRDIHITPYYPDRIIHHMINQILEPIFVPTFIKDTYQCIKGRGSHKAINKAKLHVQHHFDQYVLKVDISKFYPSVDNELMKRKVSLKIKDKRFLSVVNSLIDSHKGLPVGNYTSQLLGNVFLNDLDHAMKGISTTYLRYADDILIFGSKSLCQYALKEMKVYFEQNGLKFNNSTQLFPLAKRTLLFLGFRFYRGYIRPSKKTLIRMSKAIRFGLSYHSKASLYGWLKNSKSLVLMCRLFENKIKEIINNTTRVKHFIIPFLIERLGVQK